MSRAHAPFTDTHLHADNHDHCYVLYWSSTFRSGTDQVRVKRSQRPRPSSGRGVRSPPLSAGAVSVAGRSASSAPRGCACAEAEGRGRARAAGRAERAERERELCVLVPAPRRAKVSHHCLVRVCGGYHHWGPAIAAPFQIKAHGSTTKGPLSEGPPSNREGACALRSPDPHRPRWRAAFSIAERDDRLSPPALQRRTPGGGRAGGGPPRRPPLAGAPACYVDGCPDPDYAPRSPAP